MTYGIQSLTSQPNFKPPMRRLLKIVVIKFYHRLNSSDVLYIYECRTKCDEL